MDLTFTLKDVIWICVLLVSLLGAYWAMKLKVQRLSDVKSDKKELIECIEKLATEFNETVKGLKTDVGKAMSEMVGTYHLLNVEQKTFMAKTETENLTQERNISALWTEVNKIKNKRAEG